MHTRFWFPLIVAATCIIPASVRGGTGDEPRYVRLASGVSGHIHPAACVTQKGTVLVVFSQSDMKDLRLSRSTDGGKTWSQPVPFSPTENLSIYPGSLTTLGDGRIIHIWNTWYADANAKGRSEERRVGKECRL